MLGNPTGESSIKYFAQITLQLERIAQNHSFEYDQHSFGAVTVGRVEFYCRQPSRFKPQIIQLIFNSVNRKRSGCASKHPVSEWTRIENSLVMNTVNNVPWLLLPITLYRLEPTPFWIQFHFVSSLICSYKTP